MAVVVAIADVLGICVAVVRILRRADRTDRHLSLGGVAVAGTLIAIVALRADVLPLLVVLVLAGLAVLAGVWFRPQIIRWRGMKGRGFAVPLGPNPFELVGLVVIMTALVWPDPPPPTAEERDTTRYGLKINRHVDRVASRVLDRTPTVADASRNLAVAVPIEKYARDGAGLTLVVLHHAFCEPVEVLFARGAAGLEAVVLVAPYERFAADAPACRVADETDVLAWHSALDVVLPEALPALPVTDVGASGPALAVTAAPHR